VGHFDGSDDFHHAARPCVGSLCTALHRTRTSGRRGNGVASEDRLGTDLDAVIVIGDDQKEIYHEDNGAKLARVGTGTAMGRRLELGGDDPITNRVTVIMEELAPVPSGKAVDRLRRLLTARAPG
jgi:hypothetical protein